MFQVLLKLITIEDEDSEELQESALETLVELAEKDDLKPKFLPLNIHKTLLNLAKTKFYNAEHGKTIQKYVLKAIANLSLDDSTIVSFFEYFEFILSLALTEEPEFVLSGLMILGNLARADDHCIKMIDNKDLLSFLFKTLRHKDLRIVHLSVGAIHNLSIPGTNKLKLINAGVIPLLIELLKNKENPNQLLQYAIVGTIRSLIVIGDPTITEFVKEGGLPTLVQLARGELNPKEETQGPNDEQKEEKKEPDKRVQYEAARVIARFTEKSEYAVLLAKLGAIPSILELINSKFEILQAEGVKSILHFAQIGDLKLELLESGTLKVLENLKNENPQVQEAVAKIDAILKS